MALIIDIETTSWFKDENHQDLTIAERRNKTITKDEAKMEDDKKKILKQAALSPYTGMVTMVGFRDTEMNESFIVTNDYIDPIDGWVLAYKNEALLLEAVWTYVSKAIQEGNRLVGFRSKDFDIPYLFVRSLINQVEANIPYLDLIHPYTHNIHLDIKSLFDKGSLREIAYVLNAQTNNETDGSELPQLWLTDPGKVVEKCKSDLIQTEQIYNRIKGWVPQRLQMY